VTDKVVYLAFSNRETVAEGIDFVACKHCRNKTFTLTHDSAEGFPMAKCAACGAHIGRVGWADSA
jgi:ribosomal protein S27E